MVASMLRSPHSARKMRLATSSRLAKGVAAPLPWMRPLLVASATASCASASSSSLVLLLPPDSRAASSVSQFGWVGARAGTSSHTGTSSQRT
jgi:hypothetical protein